jgi:hypothetical protein
MQEMTANAFTLIAQETEHLKAVARARGFSASTNLRFLTVLTPCV